MLSSCEMECGETPLPARDAPRTMHSRLDAWLCSFWAGGTQVIWDSPGGGIDYPSSPSLVRVGDQTFCMQMARLDFQRGIASDDFKNATWMGHLRRLPAQAPPLHSRVLAELPCGMGG